MIIAVDFDGTCVAHAYPQMGIEVPYAVKVMHALAKQHHLVLWTARSGIRLTEAVEWFADREIPLFGINRLPFVGMLPNSPKIVADLYVDDKGFGCPLLPWSGGSVVDWRSVAQALLPVGWEAGAPLPGDPP